MSFLKKENSSIFNFKRKFFVKHNCYLLKEKSKNLFHSPTHKRNNKSYRQDIE